MPESPDEKVDAFMDMYHRLAPKMQRIAVRNFGVSPEDAVEIVQAIFVTYRMQIEEVENVAAYFLGSLCTASRKHLAAPGAEVPWSCGETPCRARRVPRPARPG